jgi:hypothetical protein
MRGILSPGVPKVKSSAPSKAAQGPSHTSLITRDFQLFVPYGNAARSLVTYVMGSIGWRLSLAATQNVRRDDQNAPHRAFMHFPDRQDSSSRESWSTLRPSAQYLPG